MKSISIRFTEEQKEKITKAAKADNRSINSFVVQAVMKQIAKSK